jgi:hypothetical protein
MQIPKGKIPAVQRQPLGQGVAVVQAAIHSASTFFIENITVNDEAN